MSRDYKNVERPGGRRSGGSLLAGIFIGLALGLIIALIVAWYINKMPNPFSTRAPASRTDTSKGAPPAAPAPVPDKGGKSTDGKQRFDFYKILPGSEEAAPDQRARDGKKPADAEGKEAFFLQAGAFSNAPEADNMKARLALLGVEAMIQTSPATDKALLHRVRMGPYTSIDELNRTRETLKQNGIATTLIRVRETEK
jgi:cell division protein FtsN